LSRKKGPVILEGYGAQVAKFLQEWMVQTKGRWAGSPLTLEPWETGFLDELFLVYEDGTRVYDEALLGVARKNGKSSISAGLALYMLVGAGEDGPEVYSAATSRDQARIVFEQAKQYVEASPRLSDWLTVQKDVIVCKANNGVYRVLAADAPKQYGLNPFGVVIDELWAHQNPELYYALTTAQGARLNPLVVSITTAGYDRDSICYTLYERGKALEAKGIDAMREAGFLFKWYEAPIGPLVPSAEWLLANPSSWITQDQLEKSAIRLPENVFRRLHLNQWTEAEDAWVKPHEWDACGAPGDAILYDPDEWTYVAVDVGYRKDSAAITWGQWHHDRLHTGQEILLPEEQGENFGIADVRDACGRRHGQLGMVREFPYDPWSFQESAEMLVEGGVPMVEFPQTPSRMGPASETLYELVVDERLVHDRDPVARHQVMSTIATPTQRGGMQISKRKSRERIDYTVSLAMMAERAVRLRNSPPPGRRAAFL
jgi:phage terminase large subunit-like protein